MSDMFLNFSAFVEQEAPSPAVLGVEVSRLDLATVIERIIAPAPLLQPGARVFMTLGLRQAALLQRSGAFRGAMAAADLVTYGAPSIARYGRFRGCTPAGIVTGGAVVTELLDRADVAAGQRLFFVVDHQVTAVAARAWADERGAQAEVRIAPACLDDEDRIALAEDVTAFGTTILLLGLDAPQAELFAIGYRDCLPEGCWALCVGDGLEAALVHRPMAGVSRRPLAMRDRIGAACRNAGHSLSFLLMAFREANAMTAAHVRPSRRSRITYRAPRRSAASRRS